MKTLACFVALALVAGITAEEKNTITEISKEGLTLGQAKGSIDKPTEIASKEDLKKAIADEKSRDKIQKEVDFEKQQIIYFSWAGSGGDKIATLIASDKNLEVTFEYTRGLTRDLRQHHHFYVLPKTAKWKVEKK